MTSFAAWQAYQGRVLLVRKPLGDLLLEHLCLHIRLLRQVLAGGGVGGGPRAASLRVLGVASREVARRSFPCVGGVWDFSGTGKPG